MTKGTSRSPDLTDKQKLCLGPAKNTMVSAGAGSGKTFLLVRKMGDLFCRDDSGEFHVGTENVLALTFTRKAASEMRGRVYGEILDRIARTTDDAQRVHLLRLRENFHAAKIATIHSFAAGLIRNHPLAAGIDPDFDLLDQAREISFINDAVRSTLDQRWRKEDPDLLRLLELWEPYLLKEMLEGLLRRPIELTELLRTYANEDIPALLRRIQAARWLELKASVKAPGGRLDEIDIVRKHCIEIVRAKGNSKTDQARKEKAARLLNEFVAPLIGLLTSDSPPRLTSAFFAELRNRVAEIGRFKWDGPTALGIVDALKEEMIPWFESLDRDQEALQWIRLLLNLAGDAQARYEEEKRRLRMLVHDDLLLRAHALCEADPKAAQGTIRHILVDEFQDTDPIQWETIVNLAGAFDQGPQNLYLVGDAKQAIYGFRGADHTVTRTAHELLGPPRPGEFAEHVLDENFRSLPAPLHFTNELFSQLFSDDDDDQNPYEVLPQALEPKRRPGDDAGEHSSVVMLVTKADELDPWTSEARAVARFLERVNRGEVNEYSAITDLMREGKPAVGILFRTHAPMTNYVTELLQCGLPFAVYHGRTFFEAPEVESLLNLLQWLSDSDDDLALTAVLRSPLFSWSDENLVLLSRLAGGGRASLQEKLERAAKHADAALFQDDPASRTWDTLSRLKKLACHLSLSETLRAALDSTMAPLIFSHGARGSQAEANIEKFLSMVREMEAAEGATAKTIFEALLNRRDAGEGEAEAVSPAPERAAIQLMTIHAAKGLEFPMVITACCGRSAQARSRWFSKRITLTDPQEPRRLRRLTLCGLDLPDPFQEMIPSPTFVKALLKEHDRMQRSAEEKRLLYVALTRARDHLLIPALVGEKRIIAARGSHAELLLTAIPALKNAVVAHEREMNVGKTTIRIAYDEPAQPAPLDELEVKLENWAADIRAARFPFPQPTPLVGQMPYPRKTRLSVTEIMTFAKCPRRFYFEKFFRPHATPGIIGRAAREDGYDGPEEQAQTADKAALVGTLVHKILEKHEDLVRPWGTESDVPRELLQAVTEVISSLGGVEKAGAEEITNRVFAHLHHLARSGILGEAATQPAQEHLPILREVPFELEHSDFIIAGAIDRLQKLPDGTWSLWDYKTTQTAGRSPEDLIREEAYEVQVRFYAWACNQILEGGVSSAAIVFTADTEATFCSVLVEPQTIERTVSDTLNRMSGVLDKGVDAFKPARNVRACESCPCPDVGLC